jgi:hypothetical protein
MTGVKRPHDDMECDDSTSKTLRSTLSEAYHARAEETRAKQGQTRSIPDPDNYEEEELSGTIKASSGPSPCGPVPPSQVPVLSLRELMPEGAQNTDPEDRTLDVKFRADKVEFLLVKRAVTDEERASGKVLSDVNECGWQIPTADEYFEAIGKATDAYTDQDPTFIHGLSWSSVGNLTGSGVFTVKTGVMSHMVGFRALLRDLIIGGQCFESIPKQALLNKYSLTLYVPPNIRHVDTKKVLI